MPTKLANYAHFLGLPDHIKPKFAVSLLLQLYMFLNNKKVLYIRMGLFLLFLVVLLKCLNSCIQVNEYWHWSKWKFDGLSLTQKISKKYEPNLLYMGSYTVIRITLCTYSSCTTQMYLVLVYHLLHTFYVSKKGVRKTLNLQLLKIAMNVNFQ